MTGKRWSNDDEHTNFGFCGFGSEPDIDAERRRQSRQNNQLSAVRSTLYWTGDRNLDLKPATYFFINFFSTFVSLLLPSIVNSS